MQGVVDVRLANEIAVNWMKFVVELRPPAALPPINEMARDEIPNAAIPFLIEGIAFMRGQKRRRADPLAARPPDTVANARRAAPFERIIKAASRIPADTALAARNTVRSAAFANIVFISNSLSRVHLPDASSGMCLFP